MTLYKMTNYKNSISLSDSERDLLVDGLIDLVVVTHKYTTGESVRVVSATAFAQPKRIPLYDSRDRYLGTSKYWVAEFEARDW